MVGCNSGRASPSLHRNRPSAIPTTNPGGTPLIIRGKLFRQPEPALKALALLLYAMGNMSFCAIARILGVSDVAVLNWVRDEARKLPEPSLKAELVVVTLDEMWHFVKKRLTNSGFGGPMTLLLGEPLPGFLVAVMTPHAKNSSTKSASKARPSSPMTGKAITVSSPRANSSPEKT